MKKFSLSDFLSGLIIVLIFIFMMCLLIAGIKRQNQIDKESVYRTRTVEAQVINTRRYRSGYKVRTTKYRTKVMLEGEEKTFTGSSYYNLAKDKNTVLVKITQQIHNDKLIRTTYNFIE